MTNTNTEAWYKNPWVWLIIGLPMSAVVAGIATVIITAQNQPEMVVDDYYKKGKAINMELSLYENADKLGIHFQLKVDGERLALTSGTTLPAVKLKFLHPTLGKRDFNVVATPNAKGELTALLPEAIEGKWEIVVSAMDDSWRRRAIVALPSEQWLQL